MSKPKRVELLGTYFSEAGYVEGMRAVFRLPFSPFGRARLSLYPDNAADYRLVTASSQGSFAATQPTGPASSLVERVACDGLHVLKATESHVAQGLTRYRVWCDPVGVTHTIGKPPYARATPSRVRFRCTPNRHLQPAIITSRSFDGSCEVQRVREFAIDLGGHFIVRFDKWFVWDDSGERGAVTRRGFLAGLAEVDLDLHSVDTVLSELMPVFEDFLLLASLASTHRTICVGWDVHDSSGALTEHHRGGLARPMRSAPEVLDTGLVPLGMFPEFATSAWRVFRSSPYKEAIRSAVYACVPMRKQTVESDYLNLFAALEEILLAYRRSSGNEFILADDEWRLLQSSLKCAIKRTLLGRSGETRSKIYDNLGGLNRVPLRRVYEVFADQFGIDLADLWPVFDGTRHHLAGVRNKLVHGDLDTQPCLFALHTARQHLKWTLERILMRLLGWDVEMTEVRPALLHAHAFDHQHLAEARREMSRFIA